MEAVRVSVFFKQKLMVLMIDVSMACTLSKSSHTESVRPSVCWVSGLRPVLFRFRYL